MQPRSEEQYCEGTENMGGLGVKGFWMGYTLARSNTWMDVTAASAVLGLGLNPKLRPTLSPSYPYSQLIRRILTTTGIP